MTDHLDNVFNVLSPVRNTHVPHLTGVSYFIERRHRAALDNSAWTRMPLSVQNPAQTIREFRVEFGEVYNFRAVVVECRETVVDEAVNGMFAR